MRAVVTSGSRGGGMEVGRAAVAAVDPCHLAAGAAATAVRMGIVDTRTSVRMAEGEAGTAVDSMAAVEGMVVVEEGLARAVTSLAAAVAAAAIATLGAVAVGTHREGRGMTIRGMTARAAVGLAEAEVGVALLVVVEEAVVEEGGAGHCTITYARRQIVSS